MERVYNFSAGPAVLPEEVLKEAADEMLNYKGSGQSVMVISSKKRKLISETFSVFPTITKYCSFKAVLRSSLPKFP